jgi:hypothetical protein
MRIPSRTRAAQRKTGGATHYLHSQFLHHALAMSDSISSERNSLLEDFEGASEEEEEAAAIVVSTIAGAGSTDVFESTTPG